MEIIHHQEYSHFLMGTVKNLLTGINAYSNFVTATELK